MVVPFSRADMSRLFLAIAIIQVFWGTAQGHHKVLEEGDVCKSNGGIDWKCGREEDCGGSRGKAAEEGGCRSPLHCCPPAAGRSARQASDKAATYCQEVLRSCKPLHVGQRDPPLGSPGPDREKREGIVQHSTHPYMALISYEERRNWSCGGTLLSETYILTPAHCAFHPAFGSAKWVRLGSLNDTQDVAVAEIVVHPDYGTSRSSDMYSDVALLKLDTEVVFNSFVKPACLYTKPRVPYEEVRAVGWTASPKGKFSSDNPLVEAILVTQNTTLCPSVSHPTDNPPSNDNVICVGGGGKRICQGYAGSALVVRIGNRCVRNVVGVGTLDRCTLPDRPVLYTRISQFASWIQDIVWPN